MTMQRRRTTRRSGPRRRSGRNVWVNENLNLIIAGNAFSISDMLSPVADFMLFDTTIVSVIIPDLTFTCQVDDSGGLVEIRVALMTGPALMDPDDFEVLFADSIGPPWMWVNGARALSTISSLVTLPLAGGPFGPVRIKAKRRFKENNTTLWMLIQTVVEGGTTISNARLSGMVRTLLHIL